MATVGHRAVHVENDQPNPAGRWWGIHETYGTPLAMNDPQASGVEPPFTAVAREGDIPAGEGRTYEVAGRLVALFFDGEAYHAMDDLCPHMGASLASGPFVDGIVTCPWHAWRFRACDGAWCDNEKLKVNVFPVRVLNGSVEVGVPAAAP
jgi:nitrite reductase (NADH) small subunit